MSIPAVTNNNQPAQVGNPNNLCGECTYLYQSTSAVNALEAALKRGIEALQQQPSEPIGWWHNFKRRMISIVRPDLDREVINRIQWTWDKSVVALNKQEGEALHQNLRSLLHERKQHYREFQATVPGLSNHELKKGLYHLSAMGSIFKMLKAVYQREAGKVRRNLTQGVRFLHKGGVSQEDASLKQFAGIFLSVAQQIEASKAQPKAA